MTAPGRTLLALLGACLFAAPVALRAQVPDAPSPTPFTVAPRLLNVEEVQRSMARAYPVSLRDAGIGGRVTVWFYINAEGLVQNRRVNESSGHDALDRAAMTVAEVYRFSPAMNQGQPVPVWISLPMTFQVR